MGVLIDGQLVQILEGPERATKDGESTWRPGLLRLFDGRDVRVVEYRSLADATVAVGSAKPGDRLSVSVAPRVYKDRVYWRGLHVAE